MERACKFTCTSLDVIYVAVPRTYTGYLDSHKFQEISGGFLKCTDKHVSKDVFHSVNDLFTSATQC